jgi:(S)-2-hydroxyglutarate dehydrogenase
MTTDTCDIAVIGGGIVGLAVARELAERGVRRVTVLEAEDRPGTQQTGHNSGVIHSGLYYRPGSLKARNCTDGRERLYRFCAEHGIAHERCGKLVVATAAEELPRLDELERRGRANGLAGLRRLRAAELGTHEPAVAGIAGLWVPQTGIVDFGQVAAKLAALFQGQGGSLLLGARVSRIEPRAGGFVLRWRDGELAALHLVNCAGLYADRIARLCGLQPALQIVPFRGEYYRLTPARAGLVRNLIYPVPDPRFPFLGVHFTRMAKGGVEAGPNAVPALGRQGYSWGRVSPRDLVETLAYPGFRRLAVRHWRMGLGEIHRSLSKRAFVRALRRLLPALEPDDLEPHGAGVRAQAIAADGNPVDDFCILEAPGMLHVLNAPSPAATASLAIARHLAERVAAMRPRVAARR